MTIPTEEDLLKSACHIGHRSHKWNPKIKPYIYGIRKNVHIFDLTQTKTQLEKACAELADLQTAGKTILFVSTKQHSTKLLEELKNETNHPIVTKKWIPGLLTNWKTIGARIKYYLDLQDSFRTGEVEKYTKKEINSLRKKLAKLDAALSGVSGLDRTPDALFVIDAVRDVIAVREARTVGIPVFGICDSIADPDYFTIPIPCNDDAVNSVKIILETVQEALLTAKPAPAQTKEEKKESETPTTLDATPVGA